MAIFGAERYDWYVYRGNYVFEFQKRYEGTLIKGDIFGLRKATSAGGAFRLVFKKIGLNKVFSLPPKQAAEIVGMSQRTKPPTADKVDKTTAALIEKLRKLKPTPANRWKIIETLAWPKKAKDRKFPARAAAALHAVYTPAQVDKLRRFAFTSVEKLKKAVEKIERREKRQLFSGGDDSFIDALYFAFSMGKTKYEGFLKTPQKFIQTFNKLRPEEDFSACFYLD